VSALKQSVNSFTRSDALGNCSEDHSAVGATEHDFVCKAPHRHL